MGWKGTLRSIDSSLRRMEREARRQERERNRLAREQAKFEELEDAAYQVEEYEEYIETLLSVHKANTSLIEWQALADQGDPKSPTKISENEIHARNALENYRPGFFGKIFGNPEKKRAKLVKAIEDAQAKDAEAYRSALASHEERLAEISRQRDLAKRVLAGNPEALMEALNELNRFDEIGALGTHLEFRLSESGALGITLKIHSKEVIPKEQKKLLKSGKISVKQISKSNFNALHQDYVCGALLRVANETLGILPLESVIVTVRDDLLNPQTGHIEEVPILSAFVPRDTMARLNLEMIDPSDSMDNFKHNMKFKRTSGFEPVEDIYEQL